MKASTSTSPSSVPAEGGATKSSARPVQIVVGISPSSLYFGAGKDPIGTIKKAIDASKASPGKAINPMDLVISATPIAKFFAKVLAADDPSQADAKKLCQGRRVAGQVGRQGPYHADREGHS